MVCRAAYSKILTVCSIVRNVEWPGLAGVFASCTLAYLSITQGHLYFGIIILILGLVFVLLASYNSYKDKSTELIDRYEERFFIKMKEERKYAAQYLLEEIESSACLKYILDFFEAPIADKVAKRQINAKDVYNYFRHWIELYWQASQKDIEAYQKSDPGAWGSFKGLYDTIVDLEKKELKERYIPWDAQRIKEALKDEASLPV